MELRLVLPLMVLSCRWVTVSQCPVVCLLAMSWRSVMSSRVGIGMSMRSLPWTNWWQRGRLRWPRSSVKPFWACKALSRGWWWATGWSPRNCTTHLSWSTCLGLGSITPHRVGLVPRWSNMGEVVCQSWPCCNCSHSHHGGSSLVSPCVAHGFCGSKAFHLRCGSSPRRGVWKLGYNSW